MSLLLKDIYTKSFYNDFLLRIKFILPNINQQQFINLIFDKDWLNKELKARIRHTTLVLHQFMPSNYAQASIKIIEIVKHLQKNNIKLSHIEYSFLSDYIEVFGLDYLPESIVAIEVVSPYSSCEFCIRPFIIKYPKQIMEQLLIWSQHPNEHIRRLASEGCRPRLPWAIALTEFKKNPKPILPILENLKNDPSEYVRRSVANNLNDITKDYPELVITIAKQWKGLSKQTDAIIKHACRNLLKQGYPEILKYYNLHKNDNIKIDNFNLHTPYVIIGNNLNFSFTITNSTKQQQQIRLEYAIYYLRQNGHHNKKVFKISERILEPNQSVDITKNQSFKIITTRQFYQGIQHLAIHLNGQEQQKVSFELIK